MALIVAVAAFRRRTHRLIASRWPTVGVFDDLVDPGDAEAAMALEALTNDRLTGALGRLSAIPPADRAVGSPNATIVMAAFLHPALGGGRFNRETLGAWYASLDLRTAIAETTFHHGRRLAASAAGFPAAIQMRELISTPNTHLHDLRRLRGAHPELYDADDYRPSQAYGEQLRAGGANGIVYDSIRRRSGTNVVIYRPRLVVPVAQGEHFVYQWDAAGTSQVRKLTNIG